MRLAAELIHMDISFGSTCVRCVWGIMGMGCVELADDAANEEEEEEKEEEGSELDKTHVPSLFRLKSDRALYTLFNNCAARIISCVIEALPEGPRGTGTVIRNLGVEG